MTIEEGMADWLATRPAWQQDAVASMCRNKFLEEADFKRIADGLMAGRAVALTRVTAADIPGSPVSTAGVRLVQVRNVRGVNDLAEGELLTFGERGLTVVYGFNASGKSGYARLLRRGVSARVGIEVLGNVFGSGSQPVQDAEIDYAEATGGTSSWTWGSPPSAALAQVRFYDRDCGQAYIDTASEIIYRPSALILLERLVASCDEVAKELDARLAANEASRASLPALPPDTRAGKFLSSVSAETTEEQIAAAITLDEGFGERVGLLLGEEARLEASDPTRDSSDCEPWQRPT